VSNAKPSILVTGATGFIGQHVLSAFAARGVRVTALARDTSKLAQFSDHHDVLAGGYHHNDLGWLAENKPHDILLHLAWSGLPHYKSLHHFEDELPRQYQFLKEAISRGYGSIVVTGTCFEYGMASGPLNEEHLCSPANPYALAKDTLRRQLAMLQQQSHFRLTWARLFYMYGDGQAPSSLLSQLKAAVTRGDSKFPMSAGEQLRDFLPVESVAEALTALALRNSDDGIVNVCSGKPISVRTLVETWLEQNGKRIDLDLGFYPYSEFEPMAFWGDRKKIDRMIA
jgi:nucleoside-diphosphate-sugar epimerase